MPKNEKSALETIEHELYDPHKKIDDVTTHRVRGTQAYNLPTSWGESSPVIEEAEKEYGLSFGTKFLLFSSVLLLIALVFTSWRVFSSRNVVSSANIDVTADINPYIEGGEDTPLIVTLGNRNTVPLQEVALTLMYKQGTGSNDEQEKINEKREIGIIHANEYKRQDFKVALYGSESESRDVTLKLEYKIAGSNATFSKVAVKTVVLKTPPISVHIDGPNTLSVGQNGTFTISIKNNTGTSSLPSMLQMTLPNTFRIDSADPQALPRSTVWSIPSLLPGETKSVTLVGSLSGSQGETTSMRAQIGSQGDMVNSIGVVYASYSFDINLRSSPLSFDIALDTERGVADTLRYGDRTTLTITYKNTSDVTLKDVAFTLSLLGNAALLKQINPDEGYYDSQARTITWNKAILSGLSSLPPRAEGVLRVTIPIVLQGTNSPELKIALEGVGTSETKDDVIAMVSKSWIVQGSANISGKTTYKNSPFKNTGPIPPVPNAETTYTVHLVVSAQNALTDASVSFGLPLYVTWLRTTSNNNAISYDERTRTVTWALGTLAAGKTVVSDMQVSVRPSQSHVGQSPPITSGVVLDANEEVSRAHIRTTISPLTTAIFGEAWSEDPSRVAGN